MSRYIVVTTLCNKLDVAQNIADALLNKRLVAGSQIESVHSKYWWNRELEECEEYKLEFRTKESLLKEVEEEIKKVHDYEVAEISYYEIKSENMDFLNWIEKNTK